MPSSRTTLRFLRPYVSLGRVGFDLRSSMSTTWSGFHRLLSTHVATYMAGALRQACRFGGWASARPVCPYVRVPFAYLDVTPPAMQRADTGRTAFTQQPGRHSGGERRLLLLQCGARHSPTTDGASTLPIPSHSSRVLACSCDPAGCSHNTSRNTCNWVDQPGACTYSLHIGIPACYVGPFPSGISTSCPCSSTSS